MEILPYSDGRFQIAASGSHVGFIETGVSGVFLVILSRLAVPAHAAAVRAALEHLRGSGGAIMVVSMAGNGKSVANEGLALSNTFRFGPRFFEPAKAKVHALPLGRTNLVTHDGVNWRRKRTSGWSRTLRGKWAPMGFLIEVREADETVRVAPLPGERLTVSGSILTGWITLAPGDVVIRDGTEFVYHAEQPGREQMAEWWLQMFCGGGCPDPGHRRGYCHVTTQAGDPPVA